MSFSNGIDEGNGENHKNHENRESQANRVNREKLREIKQKMKKKENHCKKRNTFKSAPTAGNCTPSEFIDK